MYSGKLKAENAEAYIKVCEGMATRLDLRHKLHCAYLFQEWITNSLPSCGGPLHKHAASHDASLQGIKDIICEARADTSECPSASVAETIRPACATFPAGTFIGDDMWMFKEVAECCSADLDEYGRLICIYVNLCAQSRQAVTKIINRLAKATG